MPALRKMSTVGALVAKMNATDAKIENLKYDPAVSLLSTSLTIACRNMRSQRKVKMKEQATELKKSLAETTQLVEKKLVPLQKQKVCVESLFEVRVDANLSVCSH